ncbi:retropepsin-like aspartic protease [uncultured Bradyrhizobium sp.]|jgi:clan AA aspartic protease (TIGR02281 family)|uniref:retropepsin-like aspartic protease family protein n=1 Tax=uncultured Bradyrhizobium sp. TaxID=199684 RepID=UPI0026371B6D|nr:retropepsin-like aspartic protease [uncultured Bradyrhizobium sp.]
MAKKVVPRGATRFRISPNRPLLMVDVEVNGLGPFNFALDTGASFCVITPDMAQAIGIALEADQPTAIGAGGRIEAGFAKLSSFRLGSHVVRNLGAAVMPLDAVEQQLGVTIAGLIGYNFLKRFVVTLDYPGGFLRLKRHAISRPAPAKR